MVQNFYEEQGFEKYKQNSEGNSEWHFKIEANYCNKNKVIEVKDYE